MPAKTKLEQLKANVEAQESRLEEGMKMLDEARKNEEQKDIGSEGQSGFSQWDALERVIGLMDDLLTSYRTYTQELEKRNKWLSSRSGLPKPEEK